MNDRSYTIRNLIRWQLGNLPSEEAALLAEVCANNPAAQKNRAKVRRGLKYLASRPPVEYRQEIDSLDLAMWLDNPATPGAMRIDAAAKASDVLLINLIELFRFQHLECKTLETPEGLHSRLLKLGQVFDEPAILLPSIEATQSTSSESITTQVSQIARLQTISKDHAINAAVPTPNESVPELESEVIAKKVDPKIKTKPEVRVNSNPTTPSILEFEVSSSDLESYGVSPPESANKEAFGEIHWRQLVVPLAAGFLLLLIGWIWFGMTNGNDDSQSAEKLETLEKNEIADNISNTTELTNQNAFDESSTQGQKSIDDPIVIENLTPKGHEEPVAIANADKSSPAQRSASNDANPAVSDHAIPPNPPSNSRSAKIVDDRFTPALEWRAIKGVIAIAKPDEEDLSGVNAPRDADPNDRFVTLPESWGEALLENRSTLILDEDTSVTVNRRKSNSNIMEITLFNGRVALKDLPVNSDLRVTAGEALWLIETKEEKSTVGVDFSGLVPVLFQRSGDNIINGKRVKGREQSTWQNDVYEFKNLTVPVPWISGPRGRVFNDNNEALLVAKSLSKELDALASRKNLDPQTVSFLLAARLSAAPQRAYELMQSRTPGQSELVFEWLLTQLDTARRPFIVRMLAERTGDRQQVQNMLHSFRQLRNPQTIGVELVDDACRHLTSQEVFFRVAAKQFLVKLSNNSNPVNYDVHDPPQTREEKARRWNSALRGRGNSPRKR